MLEPTFKRKANWYPIEIHTYRILRSSLGIWYQVEAKIKQHSRTFLCEMTVLRSLNDRWSLSTQAFKIEVAHNLIEEATRRHDGGQGRRMKPAPKVFLHILILILRHHVKFTPFIEVHALVLNTMVTIFRLATELAILGPDPVGSMLFSTTWTLMTTPTESRNARWIHLPCSL